MHLLDLRALRGMAEPASVDALASLYRALSPHASTDDSLDPTAWTVVFVESPDADAPDAWASRVGSAAGRLRHFGVAVTAISRSGAGGRAAASAEGVGHVSGGPETASLGGVYLLGGPLHGWWLPAPDAGDAGNAADPADAGLAALLDLVERARLRAWQGLISDPPVLEKLHKPGSDSTGVVQFRSADSVVAKIGPRDVIESESDFIATANAHLAQAGRRPIFPHLRAVEVQGRQAASVMEAAEPVPVGRLFADEARTHLAYDAADTLDAHLSSLAEWYRLTAEPGRRPTVADYLYRERFTALREHPAFTATFSGRFPAADLDTVLSARVLLPGGARVAGYTEATRWLDENSGPLLPSWGASVHGDIYMSNMLQRGDGSPVFIDPRTVWDGRDRPDPGFGDPVFDLATLLHGVQPMAAVLHAVATDRSADLLDLGAVDLGGGELDLSSLSLPTDVGDDLRALEKRLRQVLPVAEPEPVVRARLYIGAAASLAGWLKYDRTLRTPESWLATYAFLVWYLARARGACDTDREPTP